MEGRSRFSSLISIAEYGRPINDKWPKIRRFAYFRLLVRTTLSTSYRRGCVRLAARGPKRRNQNAIL
jgi:hypothetical protein